MLIKNKQRKDLLNRINNLPDDKLEKLKKYIDELETTDFNESEILEYSGIFNDLDDDTINDLTVKLPEIRKNDNPRIPEF